MTTERYECVCTTCETTEVTEALDRAQTLFNDHAAQGCEVVLRNITPSADPTAPESPRSDASTGESSPVEE